MADFQVNGNEEVKEKSVEAEKEVFLDNDKKMHSVNTEEKKKEMVTVLSKRKYDIYLCKMQIKIAGDEKIVVFNVFDNADNILISDSKSLNVGPRKEVIYILSAFYLLDELYDFLKKNDLKIMYQLVLNADFREGWDFLVKPKFNRYLKKIFSFNKKYKSNGK